MLSRGANSLKTNPPVPKRAGGFFCFCTGRTYRQQAKPVIYLGFSPKQEQVLLRFGNKKSKPPLFEWCAEGVAPQKSGTRGGLEKEHIARNAVPYKGGNVTYRRKHRGTAFLREKERVFVCPYYIGAGRKKKYSVGIQSENFSRMKPERRPGSRARK